MKKTFITLLALCGVAMGTETPIPFTKPDGGTLKTGNSGFTWNTTTYGDKLTSWELSFTLTMAQDLVDGKEHIFNLNSKSDAYVGYHLDVSNSGITLLSETQESLISVSGDLTTGNSASVILKYINNIDIEGAAQGTGTFTLTLGDQTQTIAVTNGSENTAIFGNDNLGRLWTNGGIETFSNITLTKLSDNTVPEPATATLSLLALAGLAARRRRR